MRNVVIFTLAVAAFSCSDIFNPPPKPEVLSIEIVPADTTVDLIDPPVQFTVRVEIKNETSAKDREVVCFSPEGVTTTLYVSAGGSPYIWAHPDVVGKYEVVCRSVRDPATVATATVKVAKFEMLAFTRYGDDSTRARCYGVPCEEIYIQRLDGTGLRRITTTPMFQDFQPSWFPDGKRIAFIRSNPPPIYIQTICIVDVRSAGTQCLNLGPAGAQAPSVSPDGKKIVFAYQEHETVPGPFVAAGIAVVDADGKNFTRLTRNACSGFCSIEYKPTWSPDGEWIIFARPDNNIWKMRRDGSEQTKLIERAFQAVYSPDGSRIAFTVQRWYSGTGKEQIWVMNADGSNIRQLSPDDDNYRDPAWSPDGRRIAFRSMAHITNDTFDKDGEIWVMNADGTGEPVNVTNSPKNAEHSPAWRP